MAGVDFLTAYLHACQRIPDLLYEVLHIRYVELDCELLKNTLTLSPTLRSCTCRVRRSPPAFSARLPLRRTALAHFRRRAPTTGAWPFSGLLATLHLCTLHSAPPLLPHPLCGMQLLSHGKRFIRGSWETAVIVHPGQYFAFCTHWA